MAREYLKDVEFLKKLDEMRIREHYVKLQVFNFQEKPLREIQGIATAGNITVNGSSAVRRTINLTMVSPADENDLSNIDNIISANKKIKVELGVKNPFNDYKFYGDIIWFPVGYFLITEAQSSTSATTATITLKGKDKMCLLDGTIGGVLPSTVSFHEGNEIDENGNITVTSIPILTIIRECVKFYGQEHETNIIINDIEETAKQSIQYIGNEPVWFDEDFKLSPFFGDVPPEEENQYTRKYIYGQDVGYMETDFTFPGELVFEAGSTVTEVLDKIVQTLGNYEYFYDLDGHFVFQEKKNYLNHYYTPVTELRDYFYIRAFSDTKYHSVFDNAKSSISYYLAPKYDNLKNDFIVWGTHTDKDGITNNIKYHLVIDEKPIIDLAGQYMWDACDGNGNHMFYVFDYENKRYEEQNGPTQEPIEIEYADSVKEEELQSNITNYINQNYIDYVSRETSFVIWLKVTWHKQVRYYYAKIIEGQLAQLIHYEELQQQIHEEEIVIAIRRPYEKEVEVDEEGNLIIEPSNPDMDTENKFDDKEEKEESLQEEKDSEKEEAKTEIRTFKEEHFTALQIQQDENGLFYLGYYDVANNEWQKVYELGETSKIFSNKLQSILTSIGSDYTTRVYIFKDFNKDNKYSFSEISTINAISLVDDGAKPNQLKIDDQEAEFYYEFEPLTWRDVVVLSDEEREELIKWLSTQYPDNWTNLQIDIETIYNESKGQDLLPDYNPDMDTENKFDDEEKNKDDTSQILSLTDEPSEEKDKNIIDRLLFGWSNWLDELINGKKEEEKPSGKPEDGDGNESTEEDNPSEDKEDVSKIFKVIKEKKYADLIYKYATSGLTSQDLYLEIISYYGNNCIVKNFNSSYILTIQTEDVIDPEFDYGENIIYSLIGRPCEEWREELYRQALLNSESAGEQGFYDSELLAFWRTNFDTMNEVWKMEWEDNFEESPWDGWNPAIYRDPGLLVYWLDFLDNDQIVSKYSVNQIGRRTKAVSKENIKMLYKLEVPDVMFFKNESEYNESILQEYWSYGQKYCALKANEMRYFISSGTGSTAFDLIREMLYQHLSFNTSVTITCVPKYYLEPNNVVYIRDDKSNIQGDYIITQYTVPLTYNGTMSISCTQTLMRV